MPSRKDFTHAAYTEAAHCNQGRETRVTAAAALARLPPVMPDKKRHPRRTRRPNLRFVVETKGAANLAPRVATFGTSARASMLLA